MPSRHEAVLAVDQSLDECRFVGIRATPGERVHVSVDFVVEDEASMWARVDDLLAADSKLLLAIGGALEVHVPEHLTDRYVTFGTAELANWTSLIKPMISTGKLSHDGSLQLAEQVNRAVAVRTYKGATTLSAQKSPGPIEMARCMVVAVALAARPAPTRRKPAKKLAIGFSGA